jgi:hypothetical protein
VKKSGIEEVLKQVKEGEQTNHPFSRQGRSMSNDFQSLMKSVVLRGWGGGVRPGYAHQLVLTYRNDEEQFAEEKKYLIKQIQQM